MGQDPVPPCVELPKDRAGEAPLEARALSSDGVLSRLFWKKLFCTKTRNQGTSQPQCVQGVVRSWGSPQPCLRRGVLQPHSKWPSCRFICHRATRPSLKASSKRLPGEQLRVLNTLITRGVKRAGPEALRSARRAMVGTWGCGARSVPGCSLPRRIRPRPQQQEGHRHQPPTSGAGESRPHRLPKLPSWSQIWLPLENTAQPSHLLFPHHDSVFFLTLLFSWNQTEMEGEEKQEISRLAAWEPSHI